MQLILKETVETLGQEGDIVKVKPGFGRNYLIPQQKAVMATKSNLAILEQEKAAIQAKIQKNQEETEALAKAISRLTVVIEQRVGEDDKLFGSVTAADIAEKIQELGVDIDRKKIVLPEPIKTLGERNVTIKIGYQKSAVVKVQIIPQAVE
ncbi:MAG: 50S ribosomal protein L9 [Deltaproteobacteria bacterium RIFOXYD12_FULL_50_9]|nr:MAG: 50S ribosomal protein L9 [Deltaproteobacteria bacterium RIFOXYD12_FULL_50_9]